MSHLSASDPPEGIVHSKMLAAGAAAVLMLGACGGVSGTASDIPTVARTAPVEPFDPSVPPQHDDDHGSGSTGELTDRVRLGKVTLSGGRASVPVTITHPIRFGEPGASFFYEVGVDFFNPADDGMDVDKAVARVDALKPGETITLRVHGDRTDWGTVPMADATSIAAFKNPGQ